MSNLVAIATWNAKKEQYYVVFEDGHGDGIYVKNMKKFIREEGFLTGEEVVESDWFTGRN